MLGLAVFHSIRYSRLDYVFDISLFRNQHQAPKIILTTNSPARLIQKPRPGQRQVR